MRLGPETLVDRTARRSAGAGAAAARARCVGDDSIGTLTDATYLGADNVDPELRTGLQSLRNVEEISIVAIPGEVSADGPAGR